MHLLMAYEGYPEQEPSARSVAHRIKWPGQAHQRWASLESCHVPSWRIGMGTDSRQGPLVEHSLLALTCGSPGSCSLGF